MKALLIGIGFFSVILAIFWFTDDVDEDWSARCAAEFSTLTVQNCRAIYRDAARAAEAPDATDGGARLRIAMGNCLGRSENQVELQQCQSAVLEALSHAMYAQ